mmetsp:Transcript_13507/g.25840  ORF Transcript_13507/g.25840 Transcript_13507/m.25840 type:complete len:225 (+) Transcript_13507:90-764(+)|eukprot:CAMPEP_0201598876 /NCGR_PEP_ID=MMETSP0492-20130828/545_1 /ASSEMBLY_ACC=CAM_ASM_000837 /TAXON_ID=420259 /ORGANISM="Thalassiosira gravida, Strain GMp14c1" /LENGTH=224 /DNA_ID=CAMNT_0048061369 /DNA_START=47 /DNA_END=721 /DNA_ORIENTATION=+
MANTIEILGITIELDSKGIPLKHIGYPDQFSVAFFYAIGNIVLGGIGLAAAWFLAYAPDAKRGNVDTKIGLLAEHDLGWLYLGIFLLKILQLPIGTMLGEARRGSKVAVPDQHVYSVMGSEGSKLGYVLMERDGIHGAFNRAQRALMNYHETFPTLALQYVAASWVFPFEAFVCVIVWAVTRCIGAMGYKSSADARFNGNMLGLIAMCAIQGMVLIAAIKTLTV